VATIREVAKLAGVSVATVSRVLNSQGYVGVDTRKKVEQAIKALNYTPNAVARSLFNKQSKSIGFIIPDITNPFFPQLVKAVEETLTEQGYTVLLFNSDENLEKISKIIDLMKAEYVAGALIVSDHVKEEHLSNISIPVVAIDRTISGNIPSVTVNNYENAREAVRFLIQQGCSRIAHIRGPKEVYTSEERYRGYCDEMAAQGLPQFVTFGNYELVTSSQATISLLAEHPQIDAFFAGNDIMAVGVIKSLTSLGIPIPEQIKVIGFDGIEWGTTVTPELTTMMQPIQQLGHKSGELLLDIINGSHQGSQHFSFDACLIERQSTNGRG
jgi:LacI family transcriptional regulator